MNISRRDFLKGSLASAAAVAATSVIGVSAFADEASDASVIVPEGLTEAEVKDSVVEQQKSKIPWLNSAQLLPMKKLTVTSLS